MTKTSKKTIKHSSIPFVSVVTPTFGRHKFLPWLIRMFNNQTYPQDRMELIILDDSLDEICDPQLKNMIDNQKNIRYIYKQGESRMTIGAKRNMLNKLAKGDIIVAMDDDDYYPPQRVKQAVEGLKRSGLQIAGSSEMHILFVQDMSLKRFGPYGPYHATNGTFAFTKEYAQTHAYDENVAFGEESSFTANFSIPLKQLNPYDTILCIAHKRNTFDKSIIKDQGIPLSCTPKSIVKDPEILKFYESLTVTQQLEPPLPPVVLPAPTPV